MSMKAIKIDPTGDIQRVEITGDDVGAQNDSIYEHLGGYFEIVRPGRDACLLVDEEGLLKGLTPNPLATMISGHPMLVGAALIIGTRPGPEGEDFCDVPERFEELTDEINATRAAWEEEKNG